MNSPRILILAASTILLFILVFTRLDVALTAEILSQSNMAYIFLAILVNMAAYIMASLRFMLLLESKTRLLKMVPISFMSLFISTLTPFGVGEASKIIYLEKLERIKKSDSLSAFIIEKVFGFAVLLILGLIFSVILFNFSIAYFAFVTLVMIFFLFVLGKRTRVNVIVFRFIKILSKKLHSKAVVFEKEH